MKEINSFAYSGDKNSLTIQPVLEILQELIV